MQGGGADGTATGGRPHSTIADENASMPDTEAAGGYNIPGFKRIADTIWAPKQINNINRARFLEAARDGRAQRLVVPWDELNAAVAEAREDLWAQKGNRRHARRRIQRRRSTRVK